MKSLLARKPAVRRAVAQLIDRAGDREEGVRRPRHRRCTRCCRPGYGGQSDAFKTEYKQPSKVAAAAILKEAGIAAPVPLTVGWTPSQYGVGAKAEVLELKRQLEASGLFRVTLRGAEWPQYQELTRTGAYDLYQAGWTPSYPDADDYLTPFVNGYRTAPARRTSCCSRNGPSRTV